MGGLCRESFAWDKDHSTFSSCFTDVFMTTFVLLYAAGMTVYLALHPSRRYLSNVRRYLRGFGGLTAYSSKLDVARLAVAVVLVVSHLLAICVVLGYGTAESADAVYGYCCVLVAMVLYTLLSHYEVVKGFPENLWLKLYWVVLLVCRCLCFGKAVSLLVAQTPEAPPLSHAAVVDAYLAIVTYLLLLTEAVLYVLFNSERRRVNNESLDQRLMTLGGTTGSDLLEQSGGPEEGGSHQPADKRIPELDAGLFSSLTFTWLNKLIATGKKRPLKEDDLYDLHPSDVANNLSSMFESYWTEETRRPPGKASVTRAMWRAFGRTFVIAGVFKLCNDLVQFVSPQILNRLLDYLKRYGTEDALPVWVGFMYVFIMFAASVIQTMVLHQYFHRGMRTGMRLKSAVTTTVYRKSLRILPGMAGKQRADGTMSREAGKSTGEIVNLMSIDAQRLQDVATYLHILWSAPLQIIIALALLWIQVGPSVFGGIVVMLLTAPISAVLAKQMRAIQRELMKVKDERIKITNEVLSGMRVIKFYAWEKSFLKTITDVRDKELGLLWRYQVYQVCVRLLFMTVPVFVTAATFLLYTIIYRTSLDAATAFTSLALFNLLRFPVQFLPLMINYVMEARISVKRIQDFLETPEIRHVAALPLSEDSLRDPCIKIESAIFVWPDGTPLLNDVSFSCYLGQLTAVVGGTGSGKSGLLTALIGDLAPNEGKFSVRGKVAYTAQTAWIQNSTVKENILYGKPFDRRKYEQVLDVCALRQDLSILPAGDQTEIGEKGINVSGGQKQRIALARAVYQDADVYLLDDCLSAVDSHVAQHIFQKCIAGVLKDKCVVLVTHKLGLLQRADQVVYIDDKKVKYVGQYVGFANLPDTYAAFARAAEEHRDEVDDDVFDEEAELPHHDSAAQIARLRADSHLSNVSRQSSSQVERRLSRQESMRKEEQKRAEGALIEKEYLEAGNVSLNVYFAYIKGCGGLLMVLALIISMLSQQFGGVASNTWLSYWTDHPDIGKYIGLLVYVLCCLFQAVVTFFAILLTALAGQRGGRTFHSRLLNGIMRAPMAFFDTTPLGRVLNRFSKDTYTIDESLPNSMFSYMLILFTVIATILVIAVVLPWFIVALLPLGWLYIYTQNYYIPSSRQLKRLDSVLRSPIFAHFSETLDGVPTIRAFRAQDRFIYQNEKKIDSNLRAYYLNVASNRWLAVRLEFVGTCVVSLTALLMVSGESLVSAGLGGLAITYALSVTQSLNWMVRMASERETNIVSVERVKEYAEDIPREAEAIYEDHRPPPDWPQQGAIEFKNYQMRYRPGLPLVLKGINLSIRPGERVGIVGRTGAGKSSMLASLLRLVEPAGGVVEVDKIATTSIGLDDLRSKFSIIPQDPVLFTGTVRTNLDPFNERTDDELWEALERSHLSRKIREVEGGLEATVEEGGRNFSLGERQLICLARALLRKSKVLLLDEATSAVDQLTDKIIQTSIRTIFSGCTVMTIAHRIDTILDYDRIVVMDDGKIAEFDTPVNLFREDTIFRAMAESAGITDLPQGISAPTSGGGGSGVGMQSIETSFVNSAVHSSCTMNQPITQAN